MAVDWTNPCARATALRGAYFALISGQNESLIRTATPEGDQEVRFMAGDVAKLKSELDAAEAECAASQGLPTPARARRFAIRGGSRRGC
jgi:hypothetical protein